RVVIADDFSDGSRFASGGADVNWYSAQFSGASPPISLSVGAVSGLDGSALIVNNTDEFSPIEGSLAKACALGSNAVLTNPGDLVELSFDFKFLNPGTAQAFQFGLYDSVGTLQQGDADGQSNDDNG